MGQGRVRVGDRGCRDDPGPEVRMHQYNAHGFDISIGLLAFFACFQ